MKAALIALTLLATSSIANAWTITVTGTIYSDQGEPPINRAGIFGSQGMSLIGSAYTETITTYPSQNATVIGNGSSFSERDGDPFQISLVVNGHTFAQTVPDPFLDRSYLISGLANGLGTQDQTYQQISFGSGCWHSYGFCVNSYILAYSFGAPFVPGLDFNQSIFVTNLDPGSNTYFLFRDGPTAEGSIELYTGFYGSIDTIAVNVPEPATWALLLFGFAFFALKGIWPEGPA